VTVSGGRLEVTAGSDSRDSLQLGVTCAGCVCGLTATLHNAQLGNFALSVLFHDGQTVALPVLSVPSYSGMPETSSCLHYFSSQL
jgi:hypothetical protein